MNPNISRSACVAAIFAPILALAAPATLDVGDQLRIFSTSGVSPALYLGGAPWTVTPDVTKGQTLTFQWSGTTGASTGQVISLTVAPVYNTSPAAEWIWQWKSDNSATPASSNNPMKLRNGGQLELNTISGASLTLEPGVGITTSTNWAFNLNGSPLMTQTSSDARYLQTYTGALMFGENASANPTGIALGAQAVAFGSDSVAIGKLCGANGISALSMGYNSVAVGDYSLALGKTAVAMQEGGIAIGSQTFVFGSKSIGLGTSNTVQGTSTVAIGEGNHTLGEGATAIGQYNDASAYGAVALGAGNESTSEYSVSMGGESSASQPYAVAVGNHVQATGNSATAFGKNTIASGPSSFAAGESTAASGTHSSAFGYKTTASADKQTVVGAYNATSANALFVVGNGSASNNLKNAVEIRNDGTMHARIIRVEPAGDLSMGGFASGPAPFAP